jgi:streptomycin 6-kinase
MSVVVPERLTHNCLRTPRRTRWLTQLPDLVRELEQRWALTLDPPFDGEDGSCAWVAPATRADGTDAVLKLGMPHLEGRDEIAGLRFWDGNPTVRLLEADDTLGAMLLERCHPGASLRAWPEPEQDIVIATLLRRLWRRPPWPHPFRPLSDLTDSWTDETISAGGDWAIRGTLVFRGLLTMQELARDAPDHVLLATDLHAGNVLQARRHTWLAIDPKPFLGDPAFDATQHLLNCRERLLAEPATTITRFASLLDIDPHRIRRWLFARAAAEPRDDWSDPGLLELAHALAPARHR